MFIYPLLWSIVFLCNFRSHCLHQIWYTVKWSLKTFLSFVVLHRYSPPVIAIDHYVSWGFFSENSSICWQVHTGRNSLFWAKLIKEENLIPKMGMQDFVWEERNNYRCSTCRYSRGPSLFACLLRCSRWILYNLSFFKLIVCPFTWFICWRHDSSVWVSSCFFLWPFFRLFVHLVNSLFRKRCLWIHVF